MDAPNMTKAEIYNEQYDSAVNLQKTNESWDLQKTNESWIHQLWSESTGGVAESTGGIVESSYESWS